MLHSILRKIGFAAAGRVLSGVAAGKYGQGWADLYHALQGHKTVTGLLFLLLTAALAAQGQIDLTAELSGSVAALLITAGLLDKAWRTPPPSITSARWYRLAQTHGADLTAGAAILGGYLTTCGGDTAEMLARLHLTCGSALAILGVLCACATSIGIDVRLADHPTEGKPGPLVGR